MYYSGIDQHKQFSYITTVNDDGIIVKQAELKNNNFGCLCAPIAELGLGFSFTTLLAKCVCSAFCNSILLSVQSSIRK
ncbi:MAG: hypothetical protein M0Q21_07755 [Ignavibacteriaceae bacterium]|nr:hypothetical protein [Ignavibacteriaceae bacterium]